MYLINLAMKDHKDCNCDNCTCDKDSKKNKITLGPLDKTRKTFKFLFWNG